MSSHGFSTLVRGVRISYDLTDIVNKLNRFDSKTGQPKVVEEDSFHIVAQCQGASISLPEETILFEESKKGNYQSYWTRDRIETRIYEWLWSALPTDGDDENDAPRLRSFERGRLVGIHIAHGCSDDDRIVEVNEEPRTDFQDPLKDILCQLFQCSKNFQPALFLLTTQG